MFTGFYQFFQWKKEALPKSRKYPEFPIKVISENHNYEK